MRIPFTAIIASVCLVAQIGIAQRGQVTITHTTQALKQPGATDSVAATFAEGTTLRICEVRGEWLKAFSTAKKALWIHKDATDVWPADKAILDKTVALYDRPGKQAGGLKENMEPSGTVPEGSEVQIETARGNWYEVRLKDGTTGWLHQMFATRSLLPPAQVRQNVYLSKDSANILKTMTNTKLVEGAPCVILGFGTNYTHVRALTGEEGWVFTSFVAYEDATPPGHNIAWFFHFMRGIDRWGDSGWKWLAVFILWWVVLPAAYSTVFAWIGLFAFGRIRILPNLVVRIVIYLTVFAGLVIITNVPGQVYPYSETTFGTLWSLLLMIVPPVSMAGMVNKIRCPKCSEMANHPVVAMADAGTEIRGTISSSGNINAHTVTHVTVTYECIACKQRWRMTE
jgi:SH3-like domain-containing protein